MTISRLIAPAAALLAVAIATPAAAAGDAAKGATAFKAKCQICHVINAGQKGTMAPNLRGVVGRKAGSTDFALYSPQLKAFGKPWNAALLDQWLTAPAKLVPGARMAMNVPAKADRDDVIAYLTTLK
ncbi:c-type cytochrome [Novosphingobium umbonatum]|jgi:cytochrome c|uniref:C-type cytochrome n=1 Tax=Novosphingobium umbonatum TaxID=1908524 RepID=A0A3S2X472_9SPHN|nr:c-type cytochrome [Novosphingobium umbonatum]RVU05312.1 c-type cytochrome [Novosphingobium umbonatum]